jgi:hypothetical protein
MASHNQDPPATWYIGIHDSNLQLHPDDGESGDPITESMSVSQLKNVGEPPFLMLDMSFANH